jgi:hypothetical protein
MATQDPLAVLDSLTPSRLREEIAQLDGRRRALVVLLRAATARERKQQPRPAGDRKEVARA